MNRMERLVRVVVVAVILAFATAATNQGPPNPAPEPNPTQTNPYPGRATIQVDAAAVSPANFSGHFENIAVQSYQSVPVTVTWPAGDPSDGVLVYAIHGGWIDGASQRFFPLTNTKTIQFQFKNSGSPGLYQVILRRGTTEETVQFTVPVPTNTVQQAQGKRP